MQIQTKHYKYFVFYKVKSTLSFCVKNYLLDLFLVCGKNK
jgi:hypothetical protein